jgi:hypothetical protein
MNPSEKTPKELTELADTFYRSMNYEIANVLYTAAMAKAVIEVMETLGMSEIPEAPEVVEAPKAPKAKRAK